MGLNLLRTVFIRVKSGNFGHQVFGQRPCLFHILNIVIKNRF